MQPKPKDYLKDISSAARELSLRVKDCGLDFAPMFLQSSRELEKLAPNHPSTADVDSISETILMRDLFASKWGKTK